MRILFLVDGYYPGVGGAEIQATLLAKTLIQRGHQVQVVAPHLLPELPLEDTWQGIPVRRIAYFHVPKLANIFYMISFAHFLFKHGRDYDAYHIHMVHKMASVVAIMKRFLGKPVLAKVSGATEFEGGVLDFREDAFYKRALRKLLMRLDYFQSLSSYSKSQILAAGARQDQVITLANGLDIQRFELSEALHNDDSVQSQTVIAYCGRLQEVKALPVLLQAVACLRNKGYDEFLLRLAGDGDQEEHLRELTKELGLCDYVEFCGRISDVPSFLSQAHIYVQVSRYEGLSNSVLEAMCTGLPPVLTRISGNEDLVVHGKSGYLVDVDDVQELAKQLSTLLDDRAHCRSLGLAARARVENLCALEKVVDVLERIYSGQYQPSLEPELSIEAR